MTESAEQEGPNSAENPEENSVGAELNQDELTYEEAYARLEQILESLEAGDLPLEESLSLYELGAALSTYCARKLDEAELRVRRWQPDGTLTPFTDWAEE